ncbi:MAG: choice-of-anchor D domain-containing protein, partial [Pseudomonadota bacterium]|nr:choice-of-anchor D domain-containing protein [Pseudomonadota bacterium]
MKYNYWRFKFPLLTVWVFIFLIATTRAQIQVNPTRHDFGDVNIESASPGQTFTLTNTGSDTLTLGKIQPLDEMGNPSTLFLVVNDPCSQQAVTAAGRCQITAVFQPQDLGPRTATLTITSNDPQMSQLGVPLMGNGIDVSMPQSDITVEPMSHDFGELNIGLRSEYLSLKIANTGNKRLQLKDIALEGSDFIHTDLCSSRGVGPNQVCWTQVQFEALSPPGIKSGLLQIPSDDSDTPLVEVSLTGTSTPWCSGNYKQGLRMRPETPDFGVEVVGQDSRSLRLRVRAWARGCGALEVTDVQLEGSHADEFTIEDLECQHGDRRRTHYSACQFRVIFNPASAGLKSANVALTFSDNQTRYLPLQAQAVEPPAAAGIEVTPMTAEFEPLEVGAVSEPQTFVVRNNGTVNLHFETISAQGPDARDFKVRGWRCVRRAGVLNPQGGQTCAIEVYFAPRSAGDKQANLTIVSNAPVVEIPLTGQGVEGSLCTDAQITIESVADGPWASATQTSNRLSYQGPSNAWNRLKNTSAVNRPVSTDIVRINSGHTITAIPEQASIRALCIDNGGILESWDNQGSGINIYASEYLENKGTIQGQAGADATDCRAQDYRSAIGQPGCANPGARIDLSVNASEGQLYNEGIIMAGQGGQGEKYGAQGGDIYLSAPFLTNVQEGFIRAGDGGDLTGTQAGQAGNGGYIGMSARNSMSNQSSKGVYSGNGGNCNFNAAQQGGRGGNIGVFAPDLNLNEPYIAGKGGRNCGTNGRDGQVVIEPNNVIDLSGAQTQIEGGNISIFGGQDWLLDLSNLNELALTASESLTLAVGEGGLIDLTGNDSPIFQAPEVYIFADDILVDEGVRLEDIIDADKIVVGPNQILYDVALIGPSIVRNQPGAVMPIQLKLANNGPEVDTYLLSMTDTANWPLSPLPATLEVEGLSVQELTANITLPATCGASNVVTVSAISQADPEVSAQVEIPV